MQHPMEKPLSACNYRDQALVAYLGHRLRGRQEPWYTVCGIATSQFRYGLGAIGAHMRVNENTNTNTNAHGTQKKSTELMLQTTLTV